MKEKILLRRRYSLKDQLLFARLSGDYNPQHIDPLESRREFFGEVVVHGIHVVLDALEALLATRRSTCSFRRITCRFTEPVLLDREIRTALVMRGKDAAQIRVFEGERVLAVLETLLNEKPESSAKTVAGSVKERKTPRFLSQDQVENRRGRLTSEVQIRSARKEFPRLFSQAPGTALTLLSLTRLVGMECPGRQSIFHAFDVEFTASRVREPLHFNVIRRDPRFPLYKIEVRNTSVSGTVDEFYRPSRCDQPSFKDVSGIVSANEFKGQCALVVGGSRGIGEIAAKIIAAGGGRVILTCNRGVADAKRVVKEIVGQGGECRMMRLDVHDPAPFFKAIAREQQLPSQIYYFPTPKIFSKKSAGFDAKLFDEFSSCYVAAFAALYEGYRKICKEDLRVFYPSTTAIDERVKNLGEYIAAKSAGEALCGYLPVFDRRLRIVVKRLPRLATDQTMTLVPYPTQNALETLLSVVREMHT